MLEYYRGEKQKKNYRNEKQKNSLFIKTKNIFKPFYFILRSLDRQTGWLYTLKTSGFEQKRDFGIKIFG